jgi:hypothetical protein
MKKTLCAAAVAVLLLDGCAHAPTALVDEASSAASQTICSGVFVSGLAPQAAYGAELKPEPGMWAVDWGLRYNVDLAAREVRASVAGGFASRSVFREGRGCTLVHGESAPSAIVLPAAAPPILPEIAGLNVAPPQSPELAGVSPGDCPVGPATRSWAAATWASGSWWRRRRTWWWCAWASPTAGPARWRESPTWCATSFARCTDASGGKSRDARGRQVAPAPALRTTCPLRSARRQPPPTCGGPRVADGLPAGLLSEFLE